MSVIILIAASDCKDTHYGQAASVGILTAIGESPLPPTEAICRRFKVCAHFPPLHSSLLILVEVIHLKL